MLSTTGVAENAGFLPRRWKNPAPYLPSSGRPAYTGPQGPTRSGALRQLPIRAWRKRSWTHVSCGQDRLGRKGPTRRNCERRRKGMTWVLVRRCLGIIGFPIWERLCVVREEDHGVGDVGVSASRNVNEVEPFLHSSRHS